MLAVSGAPGSGKSALLAKFVRDFSATHADVPVVSHFVGASAGSTDIHQMLRRLCHELARATGIAEEIPDDPRQLPQAFEQHLAAAAKRGPVVLVIDAVNQLDPHPTGGALYWLPLRLPEGVRVVMSSLPGPALDALLAREPAGLECPPLAETDAREIIDGFLRRYGKRLEPNQREELLRKPDAVRPLYLLAAFEELRTLGRYDEITDRIRELPGDTVGLFDWILARLEGEYGKPLVEA
ncbi:MAG: AAA family ATPase, partial [Armatimonadetes bacterium]|nr:AAA family ATPase [Armatimonadota bacterium]